MGRRLSNLLIDFGLPLMANGLIFGTVVDYYTRAPSLSQYSASPESLPFYIIGFTGALMTIGGLSLRERDEKMKVFQKEKEGQK